MAHLGGGVVVQEGKNYNDPISVATPCKALSLQPLACWDDCSNPVEGMDVCLLWMLCVVRYSSLRRTDPCTVESYRVWCTRVWSRNLKMWRPGPEKGCHTTRKKNYDDLLHQYIYSYCTITITHSWVQVHYTIFLPCTLNLQLQRSV